MFVLDHNPGRILMGAGALASLPAEAARLGLQRLLILTSAGQAPAAARLGELLGY